MEKKITITGTEFANAASKATTKFMNDMEQTAKKHGKEVPGLSELLTVIAFVMVLTRILFGEENRDE